MTEPGAVTAIVVAYQSREHLEGCLTALSAQTGSRIETIVADNGSTDGGPELVEKAFPSVRVLRLGENLGYAAANDRALAEARGEHVLFLNPDCRLAPDYVARALAALTRDPRAAAVQGKLRKAAAPGEPPRLDSTGIVVTRSRRNFDRDEGRPDDGRRDAAGEVFGVSGAASLWRRAALDDVAVEGEPLDASYWMYREDVDICWRARRLGWRFLYEPSATAEHGRGFGRHDRARVPRVLRHASLRNRYLTIWKNDGWGSLLRALPRLALFELAQALHVLLREPSLLLAYLDALARLPGALRKRREIRRRAKVSPREIEAWFVPPSEAGTRL